MAMINLADQYITYLAPSVSFRVQYQPNRAFRVGVEIRTGQILLQHMGDVGHAVILSKQILSKQTVACIDFAYRHAHASEYDVCI
jgi:hypothetical protein